MFFLRHPFLVLFVIALIESMLLAKIGDSIGWGVTILLILASTMVGSYLVRQQGFQTIQRLQLAMARGENPGGEMLEGVFIMAGGLLLVTPGFISDAIGFFLLIPLTRKALVALIVRHLANLPLASTIVQDQWTYQYRPGHGGNVYEGERVNPAAPTTENEQLEILISSRTATRDEPGQPGAASGSTDPGVIEGEFSRKDD